MTDTDRKHMERALTLAREARGLASPNPTVGSVIVGADGEVVGEGIHAYDDKRHAEIAALDQAGDHAKGGVVYVTLEPCNHQGRTGPCSEALLKAGVARVVCPLEDANPQVAGAGFARLREAGIQVEIADEYATQARVLNEAFFHFATTGRPFVTLKTAATLDGKIAAPDDNTGWITSEKARRHVHQVRHSHDAILTGIGTAIHDDPLLTDRTGVQRRRPLLRVVCDSLCRLPAESKLVESFDDDLVILTTSAAAPKRKELLEARGVPVHVMDAPGGRVDLKQAVAWLGEQQMLSVMIEAGSKLNWAALDEEIVDKILIYYAPKILGGLESLPIAGGIGRRSRKAAIQVKNISSFMVGEDEFAVEGYL